MPTVLVYSSDPGFRERIRVDTGDEPDPELGRLVFVDAADGPSAVAAVGAGGIDLAVLDGEAWPTGGLGLARELRNELTDPPALLVVIARPDDSWLAKWSTADASLLRPVDPLALTDCVVRLLRERRDRLPEPRRARHGLFRRG